MSHVWTSRERWILAGGVAMVCFGILWTVLLGASVYETRKNREVGCIGRYLDGQAYAPECIPIVRNYKEEAGQ